MAKIISLPKYKTQTEPASSSPDEHDTYAKLMQAHEMFSQVLHELTTLRLGLLNTAREREKDSIEQSLGD